MARRTAIAGAAATLGLLALYGASSGDVQAFRGRQLLAVEPAGVETDARTEPRSEAVTDGSLGCVDGAGKAVDFFYAFKYPENFAYAYMDKSSSQLVKGAGTLDDSSSPVYRTLQALYDAGSSASYAMWNDEHPPATTATLVETAHAKGVVAFKGSQGFYLLHSHPKFPIAMADIKPEAGGNPFQSAAPEYGQSYLCITLGKDGFDSVGTLMGMDYPSVYSAADGAGVGSSFTSWAIDKKHTESSDSIVETVTSLGGQQWVAFGKSYSWGEDLYEDLVAPHFNVDLYTETWQNGAGPLPNYVKGVDGKKYSITNIATVAFPGGATWKESEDHSKWAVDPDGKIMCVGGINRMESQRARGGGTFCIQDASYAGSLRAVVKTLKPSEAQ